MNAPLSVEARSLDAHAELGAIADEGVIGIADRPLRQRERIDRRLEIGPGLDAGDVRDRAGHRRLRTGSDRTREQNEER